LKVRVLLHQRVRPSNRNQTGKSRAATTKQKDFKEFEELQEFKERSQERGGKGANAKRIRFPNRSDLHRRAQKGTKITKGNPARNFSYIA